MTDGFNTFYTFCGIKNHFYTKSYDYWKYKKKLASNINIHSFERRRDRNFFFVIGKKFSFKRDLENYFIGNFKNDVKYVTDMVKSENSMKNYGDHAKIVDALKYNIQTDLKKIDIENKNYITSGKILKDVFRKEILLETLCFFDIFFSLFKYYDNFLNDTLYNDKRLFLGKYIIYLKNEVDKEILDIIRKLYYNKFFKGV